MSKNNWTYNEFLAFTLLYVSSVDARIEKEEIQVIICKVGEEVCKKINSEFNEMNEYERLQTILSYREKYYSSPEQKSELLENIRQLFLADNKIDSFEQGVMLYLKRLL